MAKPFAAVIATGLSYLIAGVVGLHQAFVVGPIQFAGSGLIGGILGGYIVGFLVQAIIKRSKYQTGIKAV